MLIKMETYFDGEYWCARGATDDMFMQGDTYGKLLNYVKEKLWRFF